MEPSPKLIRGETRNIGKPKDWDPELDGPCGSLSVRDEVEVQSGVNFMHSEWVLQPGELKLLADFNGVVVLRISGAIHPVVSLHVEARPPEVLELTDQLPEGLWAKGQRLFFECRSCGHETEFEGEHDDFDVNSTANVCGGSPRCCP